MSDLISLLFDWNAMSAEVGLDAIFYAVLALVGTAIFIVRFTMLSLGWGGDTDFDDIGEHGTGLPFFSLLSITAFMMGSGWMGLIARVDWELGPTLSAFLAIGFGGALMCLATVLLVGMRRLGHDVSYDVNTAVGRTATVYMTIPAKGDGTGQVQVSVSGRSKVLPAGSTGPAIDAFTSVRVVDVRDDNLLLVEPL